MICLCPRKERYNGGNLQFCIWLPLKKQVTAGVAEGFFVFLMIRYSANAQASGMLVRLLSSACEMLSEIIMLYQSACE